MGKTDVEETSLNLCTIFFLAWRITWLDLGGQKVKSMSVMLQPNPNIWTDTDWATLILETETTMIVQVLCAADSRSAWNVLCFS